MKSIISILITLFLVLPVQNASAHNNSPLELYIGAVELLPLNNIERVVVGNGKVLSAKVVDDAGILVIAEGAGESDLQIWQRDGTLRKVSVTVTSGNPINELKQLKAKLEAFPGTIITEKDGVLLVQGTVDPDYEAALEKIISNQLKVVSLVNYYRYEKPLLPMVKIKVQIVEFKKSTLNNIGVQWDTGMSGPAFGAAKAFTSNPIFTVASPGQYAEGITEAIAGSIGNLDSRGWSYFGIVTGIGSQIQLLAEKGDARLLAQPNLATRSGETASFLAGGEFPIRSLNEVGGVDIQFKEYGIRLDIEPLVDDDNNITSKIMAEVSSIDPSVSVEGTPGLLTRRTESVINVKDNETIVISGLVNSEMSKFVNKVPFLGDIPILGELFKSRDFKNNHTELVIFATPVVVYPGQEEHDSQLKRGQEMVGQADDIETFHILD
ncbi:pilus assembly protein N-terminal domain-containing protein [Shewanella corallii]|uniref:Pilus assembly protein N-terminal domain-containing protein n=1 Tax=Shewanella corallii TaxID=560080 RepID=A0ABT0N5Y7_9GAMM|nr:pilus assembly protein N-terminal domain-containing protein [Shewanella corallii]MCL2913863.1 pilus assembly protein N-terminal domain-containing protein [Shewanella corallii]